MPITSISSPFCAKLKQAFNLVSENDSGNIVLEDGQTIVMEDAPPYGLTCDDLEMQTNCCVPSFIPFRLQKLSRVPYSNELRAKHGENPTIYVYYYDQDSLEGGLMMSQVSSRVSFDTIPIGNIIIDHGGRPETGIIKIV